MMKTKLLSISLILFTAQVLADDKDSDGLVDRNIRYSPNICHKQKSDLQKYEEVLCDVFQNSFFKTRDRKSELSDDENYEQFSLSSNVILGFTYDTKIKKLLIIVEDYAYIPKEIDGETIFEKERRGAVVIPLQNPHYPDRVHFNENFSIFPTESELSKIKSRKDIKVYQELFTSDCKKNNPLYSAWICNGEINFLDEQKKLKNPALTEDAKKISQILKKYSINSKFKKMCPGSPSHWNPEIHLYWNDCIGILTNGNGTKSIGEFRHGETRGGQSAHIFTDGDKYVGGHDEFDRFYGEGTYTFANGDKYVGGWKDGHPHGQGTYTFANGDKIIGEFKSKFKDKLGHGLLIYPNKDKIKNINLSNNNKLKYKKPCKGDKWNYCYGTATNKYGDKYVGEFKNNKSHGYGIDYFANGDKYEGAYKDGKRHGLGTYNYTDGDKYVGEYKDDFKNGHGTYTDVGLGKYIGEYKDSQKHGQGTLIFDNGDKYSGEWKNGKKHGHGTYTFANEDKYVGEYKDDNQDGYGTYTFAKSGNQYVGKFKDGKRHGHGTFTLASGSKYVGESKQHKFHGHGTFIYANGDKYVGAFENNKRHGKGTFNFANGNKYVGEFKNHKKHGHGTFIYAKGDKYVGEYKNNKRHGKGTFTSSVGTRYSGQWLNGKYVGQYWEKQSGLKSMGIYMGM